MITTLQAIEDAQTLAQAIVNTIHEPFLVLDARLRVVAASRSFYQTFQVDPEHTHGRLLYALGEGQWDIPALRVLLETIIPQDTAMDDFEVSHDFPGLGQRTMLLNARMVIYETSRDTTILLAFTDVTARRAIEREKGRVAGADRRTAAAEADPAAGDGAPGRQQPADHRLDPAAEGQGGHLRREPRAPARRPRAGDVGGRGAESPARRRRHRADRGRGLSDETVRQPGRLDDRRETCRRP